MGVPSIRLGFLGSWPFRREIPIQTCWIILDLLGFSRPNRDFSMGYTDKSAESFSSRFFPGIGGAGSGPGGLGARESGVGHRESLT
jgi:hypothetical protein